MSDERIFLAHSERQHSHQLAAALSAEGILGCYLHGASIPKDVASQIPVALRKRIYWFQALRRAAHYTLSREDMKKFYSFLTDAFDRSVTLEREFARCSAVIAYETSALKTFEAAKRFGMACILDAASVHHTLQSQLVTDSNDARSCYIKDREIVLADFILTYSTLARDSYVAAGVPADKLRTVPLGVDTKMFYALPNKNSASANDIVKFCFAGNLAVHKGIDTIVTACRQLRALNKKFSLSVATSKVGADPVLIRNLEEFAFIKGKVPHSDLADFFRANDVLLLPSRFDAFPLVVGEAMACGLPVIISENVGTKDLIEEDVNGWVIPAKDPNSLAKRMEWCIDNSDALRAIGANARVTAEKWNWENYRHRAAATISDIMKTWRFTRDHSCAIN